jgi:hypothetical protein
MVSLVLLPFVLFTAFSFVNSDCHVKQSKIMYKKCVNNALHGCNDDT